MARLRVIYTMNRPEAELGAIRRLLADRSGLNPDRIYPYALSEGLDYGRVYYAAIEPETERGLIFTIGRRLHPGVTAAPQHASRWEIERLFKLANTLGLHKFTMLGPIRIWEDEIKS
jgi:hypothetical protein